MHERVEVMQGPVGGRMRRSPLWGTGREAIIMESQERKKRRGRCSSRAAVIGGPIWVLLVSVHVVVELGRGKEEVRPRLRRPKVSRYLVATFLLDGLARDLTPFCYAIAVGAVRRAWRFARWEIESGGALSVRNNSSEERRSA
jgi:hypothetical protein